MTLQKNNVTTFIGANNGLFAMTYGVTIYLTL